MLKYIYIIFIFLCWNAPAFAQEQNEILQSYVSIGSYTLTAERDPDGKILVRVDGEIGHLLDYMMPIYIQTHSPDYIELNSRGGRMDVIAKIGKIINKNAIPVRINNGEICVSACSYLALASPDIIINGQLAFHLPYFPVYDRHATLDSIMQSSVNLTIRQTRRMFKYGWKLILYYVITVETQDQPGTYLVFDDASKLDNFRFTDATDFIDVTDVTPALTYIIKSKEELLKTQVIQAQAALIKQ